LKHLLLLHTGGTLGMDPAAAGALRPGTALEGVFRYIPEALELADIETRVLFNEDSANMQIAHWRALVETIAGELDHYDGFVVIHGTDTMAYTAAALSFALENLPKPVILTGAQRPIGAIRTDAKVNLVSALELATYDLPEVGLFFNHALLRGNRSKKISIDDFDAFASPNYPALAEIGLHLVLHEERLRRPAGLFHPNPTFSDKVVVLRLFPGMRPEYLFPLLDGPALAFVIEAYGAGNVPVAERSLIPFVEAATERGKLVAVSSQALTGHVDLSLYESGQRALEAGALSCADMTVEAAVVKLMYLLGRFNEDTRQVARNFAVSLAGELTA
jgi:L-asparaginase